MREPSSSALKPSHCVVGVQGEALAHLRGLVQQAVGQDWKALPQALHKAAAFRESVHSLVFDVLMDKVPRPPAPYFPNPTPLTMHLSNI